MPTPLSPVLWPTWILPSAAFCAALSAHRNRLARCRKRRCKEQQQHRGERERIRPRRCTCGGALRKKKQACGGVVRQGRHNNPREGVLWASKRMSRTKHDEGGHGDPERERHGGPDCKGPKQQNRPPHPAPREVLHAVENLPPSGQRRISEDPSRRHPGIKTSPGPAAAAAAGIFRVSTALAGGNAAGGSGATTRRAILSQRGQLEEGVF